MIPHGPLGAQFLFGNGVYNSSISGSGVTVAGNNVTITGAATAAIDGTTGAAVVVCDTLTLDGASASLAPSTNCKGLIIFAKTKIELKNGAKLNIDKLGKAGNFGNLTVLDLVPQSIRRKLKSSLASYVVLGEGAAGAAGVVASGGAIVTGGTGSSATAGTMKTGGGGSGGGNGTSNFSTGAGGKGGPCCGGGGGSAFHSSVGPWVGNDAAPYGPGANAPATNNASAGGGAGDPVGTGVNSGGVGLGAGGGLLMMFTPLLSVASGCIISSDGAGVTDGDGSYSAPGGSAGGGCVVIVTNTGGYSNSGTVRASGGPGHPGNNRGAGGPGGAGSVNTYTLAA